MNRHFELLGMEVRDKVTTFKGVVDSISFDLYGCIQAGVTPKADRKGKQEPSHWFDVTRLEVIGTAPVMERPDFDAGYIADGKKGPAEKP